MYVYNKTCAEHLSGTTLLLIMMHWFQLESRATEEVSEESVYK